MVCGLVCNGLCYWGECTLFDLVKMISIPVIGIIIIVFLLWRMIVFEKEDGDNEN